MSETEDNDEDKSQSDNIDKSPEINQKMYEDETKEEDIKVSQSFEFFDKEEFLDFIHHKSYK